MTVTLVPSTEKTGAAALQSQVNTLAAVSSTSPAATLAAQLLLQRSNELVNTLVSQGKLNAATLLSTAGCFAANKVPANSSLPILAQIAALQTDATAWATTNQALANSANTTIASLQMQAVTELLNNGLMSAALVLSTQSYGGGAAQ